MQFNFTVADHLITATVSTAGLNPALAAMVPTNNPPCATLTFTQLKEYQRGKLDMLRQATAALHVAPMVIEPPTPAMRSSPRPQRPLPKG